MSAYRRRRVERCGPTGKRGWRRAGGAAARSYELWKRHGLTLRIYQCSLCGLWHLSRQPKHTRGGPAMTTFAPRAPASASAALRARRDVVAIITDPALRAAEALAALDRALAIIDELAAALATVTAAEDDER